MSWCEESSVWGTLHVVHLHSSVGLIAVDRLYVCIKAWRSLFDKYYYNIADGGKALPGSLAVNVTSSGFVMCESESNRGLGPHISHLVSISDLQLSPGKRRLSGFDWLDTPQFSY